jgi:pilus assembly protein CpaC
VFAFRPDLNLSAFVRALESKGVLQILAEPNLVTSNGKEASFLVGGEFPVPIVQGGANAGAVTILFKEFGIRLTFKPEVTEHSTIRMYVKPEVSTIDMANSVVFSGFTIPALATRRMETSIELGPGQSFVIAGLIDDRVADSFAKIPGLSHLPILGALFKSRDEKRTKTELIVMVTPQITAPLTAAESAAMSPEMPRAVLPPELLKQGSKPAPPAAAAPGKKPPRK